MNCLKIFIYYLVHIKKKLKIEVNNVNYVLLIYYMLNEHTQILQLLQIYY